MRNKNYICGLNSFTSTTFTLYISLCSGVQRQQKIQRERLMNDFSAALNNFQAVQRRAAEKEKESVARARAGSRLSVSRSQWWFHTTGPCYIQERLLLEFHCVLSALTMATVCFSSSFRPKTALGMKSLCLLISKSFIQGSLLSGSLLNMDRCKVDLKGQKYTRLIEYGKYKENKAVTFWSTCLHNSLQYDSTTYCSHCNKHN